MTDALILACGTGLRGESLNNFSPLAIGGLTQLRRLVRSCIKAEISRITVVSSMPEQILTEMLPESVSGPVKINFISPGKHVCENQFRGNVLALQSNLFFQSSVLKHFINEKPPTGGAVVMNTREKDRFDQTALNPIGAVITEHSAVSDLLEDCNLSRWMGRYRDEGIKQYEVPREFYAMNLDEEEQSLGKAWQLLSSSVGKTSTGWIARNINGRLSLPISSWLARHTSLTPNHISLLTNIATGVPCIFAYLTGYPFAGAVFMQIAAVLDRCDGEVARLKLLETKRGEWVDTLSDQITVGGFVFSVPIGCYLHSGHQSLAAALGIWNVSVFLLFLLWTFLFMVRYTGSGSLVSYHRIDELMEGRHLSPARKLMAFLRPVMRRNFYSLLFVFVAAIWGYTGVLAVTTLGLTGIFVHQLEDFIRLRGRFNSAD